MCCKGGALRDKGKKPRKGKSQRRKEANEGEIRISYSQMPKKQVGDVGKAFGLIGVVLSEWCL